MASSGTLGLSEDDWVALKGPIIYEDMLANAGGETNYAVFDESNALAELWAHAHAIASAWWWLEHAGEQSDPRLADELLGQLEWEYGIIPPPGATKPERRTELFYWASMPLGADRDNVEARLTEGLGADFVAYVTTSNAEFEVSGDDAIDPLLPKQGVWDAPTAEPGILRLKKPLNSVRDGFNNPTEMTAYLEPFAGNTQLSVGQRIAFDVANWTRTECIPVERITSHPSQNNEGEWRVVVKTFSPHDNDGFVVVGRVPNLSSTKRHNYIVLTAAAAVDETKRRRVDRVLRKLLRGTSTWDIVPEASPGSGTSGPFEVGVGLIGITPIQEVTF